MNVTIKPFVEIPGDTEDRIMARSGELVGLTRTRAVWRFGFLPNSDMAHTFGVSVEQFVWVLGDPRTAKVVATWSGYGCDLPTIFRRVIDGAY